MIHRETLFQNKNNNKTKNHALSLEVSTRDKSGRNIANLNYNNPLIALDFPKLLPLTVFLLTFGIR